MSKRYGSGRSKFIGQGLAVNTASITAELFTGAVAFDSGDLYYSDGTEWIQVVPPLIRRPSALAPTNETQRRQLRLTGFAPGPGYESKVTQTKIEFQLGFLPDLSDAQNIEVISASASKYDIAFDNTLGINLGETFYWRARYVGNYDDGVTISEQKSEYSKTFLQIFPDVVIETPYNVTANNAEAIRLVLSPFVSPFGYNFNSEAGDRAHFNIYNEFMDVVSSGTSTNNSFYVLNLPIEGNRSYYWNGWYEAVGIANSAYSNASLFRFPNANLVINIDTRLGGGEENSTFYLFASPSTSGADGSFNIRIDWGDGTSNTVNNSIAGIAPGSSFAHTYATPGEYRVDVGGKAR